MIDLTVKQEVLNRAIERAKNEKIIYPTFAQQRDPSLIPDVIKEKLKDVGLWEINALNLFRIGWHNEPTMHGGTFGPVNYVEIPSALTGVKAKIFMLVGKWMPTGCHKVGASFACLVPRLVTGQFDPTYHKAVWPSTGNYCRGGAFNSKLLDCYSIAILPEGMSRERFDWLNEIASETIGTPGTESNVKEVFDKTWELRRTREDCVIFNQFDEMGNPVWHYNITGPAMEEAFEAVKADGDRFTGAFFTSGSGGTISAGSYIKKLHPDLKLSVGEALQCPTILNNGFGAHRLEGIGDKHIPWVHNVKDTDMVCAIDDEDTMNLLRLFNTEVGKQYLKDEVGLTEKQVDDLSLLGISSIANLLGCIKMAKYYEMTEKDVIGSVATDSFEMYTSRVPELDEEQGEYTRDTAIRDYHAHILGIRTDNMAELNYYDRKRVHNLKYYTWVAQQGRTYEEIMDQWYDPDYWTEIQSQGPEIDALIEEFNHKAGVKL